MNWYLIDMPQASLTDGAYHRLCREFQHAFIKAGAPADLALFAKRGSATSRRLYLSPQSHSYVPDIIRHFGGRPCDVPDPSNVTLVYGVPGALTLLDRAPDYEAPMSRRDTAIYPIRSTRTAASAG